MIIRNYLFVVALPLLTLCPAAALSLETVGQTDFDGNIPYTYGYTYIDPASPASPTQITAIGAVGAGGTNGLQINSDFTGTSGTYSGFGFGGGLNLLQPLRPPQSLADLFYSVDVAASGMLSTTAGGNFEVKIEVPDDTLDTDLNTPGIQGDNGADLDILFRGEVGNLRVTQAFQTFSGSLDSFTVLEGSIELLQQYADQVNNVNTNFNFGGGFGEFGTDSNNFGFLDNIVLLQVPEPSATLFATAATGLLALRRRRSGNTMR